MKRFRAIAVCLALCLSMVLPSAALAEPNRLQLRAVWTMEVTAPTEVKADEEFTAKVTNVKDDSPVEGATVYLVPRHQQFSVDPAQDCKWSELSPNKLGTTDKEGELEVKISDIGNYFLLAEKDDTRSNFLSITVTESAGRVTFTTTKQVFNQAEKVVFVLRNGTDYTITLSRGAPFEITRPNGTRVFEPVSTTAIETLAPGDEKTWEWSQKDYDDNQVNPGVYVATIETSAGSFVTRFCISGLRVDRGRRNPEPKMEGKNPFKDVTGRELWGDPHILHLYRKGVVEGKTSDCFDPDGTLTRAEFLAMLMRAADIEPERNEGNDAFADVSPNHWAYAYVYRAREMGILTPEEYPEGFGPDIPITRLEMCIMATRALGLEHEALSNAGVELGFEDDDDIPLLYRGYVKAMVDWGVIKGYPDNTFRPDRTATRREAAVIIYRVINED